MRQSPRLRIVFALAISMFGAPPVTAGSDQPLADPAQEQRARTIGQQLRCVVCQNQSIDESNAPLAIDLRDLVRERIKSGDSDRQAFDFIVARYGNFVLLKPPLQGNTVILWLGPLLLLCIGGLLLLRFVRGDGGRRAVPDQTPMSTDEIRQLDHLLGKDARS
jgi:cytochrome c-type biogenesis protein CcmH